MPIVPASLRASPRLHLAAEIVARIALVGFYGRLCVIHTRYFLADPTRLSSLLLVLFEGIVVALTLFRSMPRSVSVKPYDWLIATYGTFAPMLLVPAPEPFPSMALQTGQWLGIVVTVGGVMSLNTSFGLVAANRSVKTGGFYRYVRHPVYAGYFLSFLAFVAQNLIAFNLAILVTTIACDVLRIQAEERFLLQDEEYRAYSSRTRWRLVPGVW